MIFPRCLGIDYEVYILENTIRRIAERSNETLSAALRLIRDSRKNDLKADSP